MILIYTDRTFAEYHDESELFNKLLNTSNEQHLIHKILLLFLLAFNQLFYSPEESSLELTIEGPLSLNGFLHLGLLFVIFSPLRILAFFLVVVVVVVGGGGLYFLVRFGFFSKLFRSCFKIVWALFLDLEGPYLRAVSTQFFFMTTKIEIFN